MSAPVEYHYILTVQQGASQMSMSTGTVTITPGAATRAQVLAHLQEENRVPPAQWAVVFFSLEPNALGGAS